MNYIKPHFVIKKNLQKSKETGVYFSDVVTPNVLKDVCLKITGFPNFTHEYVENDYQDEYLDATYNIGRLAILKYQDKVMYISFSEKDINGRNSSVQSVPTAFSRYYLNSYPKKEIYYYFLNVDGNPETDYLFLIYRLMLTIGYKFLNSDVLQQKLSQFVSIEDIISSRRINAGRNQSNNSSYITKSSVNNIDIYGKTYGANKYETSMICYALSTLAKQGQIINLYEVSEGNLKKLPKKSLEVIDQMGNINIIPTDMQKEKKVFEEENSLRSPRYIYSLLERLGKKRCALCDCEIPEIIQGAHIWPVAEIKMSKLSYDEKLSHAISGDNGLWLCGNHHKLFDEHLIILEKDGSVGYSSRLEKNHITYIDNITTITSLTDDYMSEEFVKYLAMRNRAI